MDTHKLSIFLEAVKTGSLNKTAENLGYTQPAIVHAMNSLEKELGIKLIERSNRGITLSKAGHELFADISEMVALDHKLTSKIQEINRASSQHLTISALPSVAQRMLSKPISEFQKKYPEATIDLQLSNSSVSELIRQNDIDLVITDIRFCQDVPHRVIYSEPMMALVPESWEIAKQPTVSLDDLFQHKVLLPLEKAMSSATLEIQKRAPDQMIVSTFSADILISLVEQEMGVTIISKMSAAHLPAGVRILPIKPPLERTICVCVRDFDHLSIVQKNFLSLLYDYLIIFLAGN